MDEPLLFTDDPYARAAQVGSADDGLCPLAARLRPRTFEEYAGQRHLVAPGKMLRRAIEADAFTAIILYGPPGVGKTTLAELIARLTAAHFERLSAVTAKVSDVRRVIEEAVRRRQRERGRKTILFLDEIHRFNRAQQDVLLPDVEHGNLRLIGATTENPFYQIVGPLLSRAQVFRLEPLSEDDLRAILRGALTDERGFPGRTIVLTPEAEACWVQLCDGDARRLLTAVEVAVLSTPPGPDGTIRIDQAVAEESMQQKAVVYGDDGHYDTASAFIKSMRGSDADAAIYWLAKMLTAGEDPLFIARRIVIFASEDVGNADPRALTLAVSAMQAVQMVGMPEARIILAQAVTYCATCPKSNASYLAVDQALADVREQRVQPVPVHLRDSSHPGAVRAFGHGQGYQYPHDHDGHFVAQDYLTVPTVYYEPTPHGYEARLRERIAYWRRRRAGEEPDAPPDETAPAADR